MADKPNILVIWGDDIGITNLSCYSDGLMGYRTANIDRIVVFGSKASDSITIDPSVTVPAVTLDGGHGGKNVLNAGSTPTREHGWFGRNTLVGGTDANELVGRAGHVKFRPTSTTDEIFAGVPKRRKEGHIQAPGGTRIERLRPPAGGCWPVGAATRRVVSPCGPGAGCAEASPGARTRPRAKRPTPATRRRRGKRCLGRAGSMT